MSLTEEEEVVQKERRDNVYTNTLRSLAHFCLSFPLCFFFFNERVNDHNLIVKKRTKRKNMASELYCIFVYALAALSFLFELLLVSLGDIYVV